MSIHYINIKKTTIVILSGSRACGFGIKSVESIAFGMTDTMFGSKIALKTVFSLLTKIFLFF